MSMNRHWHLQLTDPSSARMNNASNILGGGRGGNGSGGGGGGVENNVGGASNSIPSGLTGGGVTTNNIQRFLNANATSDRHRLLYRLQNQINPQTYVNATRPSINVVNNAATVAQRIQNVVGGAAADSVIYRQMLHARQIAAGRPINGNSVSAAAAGLGRAQNNIMRTSGGLLPSYTSLPSNARAATLLNDNNNLFLSSGQNIRADILRPSPSSYQSIGGLSVRATVQDLANQTLLLRNSAHRRTFTAGGPSQNYNVAIPSLREFSTQSLYASSTGATSSPRNLFVRVPNSTSLGIAPGANDIMPSVSANASNVMQRQQRSIPTPVILEGKTSNERAITSLLSTAQSPSFSGLIKNNGQKNETLATVSQTNGNTNAAKKDPESEKVLNSKQREEEDRIWMTQYYNLKMFRLEFGHCHVPAYYKVNVALGQWVNLQRHLFRQYKSSRETNGMNEKKVELLEVLGFTYKKEPGALWMAQFNLLKEFKDKNGHCHVPMHWKKDRRLGHWVNNQRQLFRKYKSGLPTSMNESRIELLEGIGFAWVLGKDWKEKRKKDKNRSHKSTSTDESPSVGSNEDILMNDQFSHEEEEDGIEYIQYSSRKKSRQAENIAKVDGLDISNEGKLSLEFDPENSEGIGTVFQVEAFGGLTSEIVETATPEQKNEVHQSSDSRKRNMKRKRQDVPEVLAGGRKLSHILFSSKPAQFGYGDDSDSDSDSESVQEKKKRRRAKVKERTTYNTDKQWNKRFDALIKFKSKFGHCHVPFQFAEDKSLSYWCSNQRQKYKQVLKGEETTLTEQRIDSLLELGFKFNARHARVNAQAKPEIKRDSKVGNRPPSSHLASWESKIASLKKYKEKHGDCLVPSIYLPNRQLGTWVMNLRQHYRRHQKGQKTSSLNPSKITVLEELGFSWFVRPRNVSVNRDAHTGGNHVCKVDGNVLCYILTFLLDIRDVLSFSATSKYYHELFNESQISHELLLRTYSHKYSSERSINMTEWRPYESVSMLDAWRDMSKLKTAVNIQTDLDESAFSLEDEVVEIYVRSEDGIGILPPRQEAQALLKDNQSLVPSNDVKIYCEGYGGMVQFDVHPPIMYDGAKLGTFQPEMKEQIAVWGDFDGIRISHSFYDNTFKNGKESFLVVGGATFGRVSTVIPVPLPQVDFKSQAHSRRPCLFVGCESGAIKALFPVLCVDEAPPEYGISAMTFAHSSSVTALSILYVPISSAAGSGEFLLSGGRDGKVHLYPNSFSMRHEFEVHSRVLCCENKTPIAALVCVERNSSLILFTGDEGGRVVMWKSRPGSTLRQSGDTDGSLSRGVRSICNFEAIFTIPSMETNSKISKLSLFKRNVLICGNNKGDVRVFDVVQKKTYAKKKRKSVLRLNASLRLSQRFIVPRAHSGNIHSLTFFGDILLTTGGNDGLTKAWSTKSGSSIGSVVSFLGADSSKLCALKNLCHTEKRVYSYEGLKSAIVSNFFCGRAMISFNRAGDLCRWEYGLLLEQNIVESIELPSIQVGKKCHICQHLNNEENNDYCEACDSPLEKDQSFENVQKTELERVHEDKMVQNQVQENIESGDSDEEDENSDADYDWECQKCFETNRTSFTRCSSCHAWRST